MSKRPVDRAAYRITEAANYLGISRTRLVELIAAGFITPIAIGERKLILRDDLDRLLASLRDGTIKIPKRKRRPYETDEWRAKYAARMTEAREAKKEKTRQRVAA